MKGAAGFAIAAFAATIQAADWEDQADPVKVTTTTTTVASTWVDYDPAKTTTTTKPVALTTTTEYYWGDVPADKTTTTTKPVVVKTTTKVVDPTHTWGDVVVVTTKPVSPATSPAVTWVDAPVAGIGSCKVVTVTKTGSIIWVPAAYDPTWVEVPVAPTTAKPTTAKPTTVDHTWIDVPVDPIVKTTTTTADYTWADVPAKPTTFTTSTKPVVKTTTTATPKPTGGVCPKDNGKTLAQGGSCGCDFQINCGVKASPGAGSKFWQRTEGEKFDTLAACLKVCDENSLCESVLYVAEAGSADSQLCWQTSGLGPITGEGYAQIAYKGQCSGKCSQSYTKKA